ncbi:acyltransferase family protein [Rhodanobacter sp. BL-MT-08]
MNRRHDIDALRVFAFALLIFYHLGMLYVAPLSDWRGMPLHSAHMSPWLQYPMLFVNRWRMELLFLISGLAVHFMRGRAGLARLAQKRSLRLLVPLIFGMLAVIPIQSYVAGLTDHAIAPGFGAFLLHYWTHGYKDYGLDWAHLWYLPYVWLYTMLLLIVLPALESRIGRLLQARCLRLRGASLLVHPVLPLFAYGVLLSWRYPETHALVGDWYALALYATMFFYGYLLGTDAALWAELARLRRHSLATALGCFALYLFLDKFAGQSIDQYIHNHAVLVVTNLLHVWLHYSYTWIAITAVLGWGHAYLNRPFRWLPYAREAVYPWYILHQSLLLFFAWQVMPLQLGPVAEPLLILLGTVAGCALLHECLIRRIRWLRPLFGLNPLPARELPDVTAMLPARMK